MSKIERITVEQLVLPGEWPKYVTRKKYEIDVEVDSEPTSTEMEEFPLPRFTEPEKEIKPTNYSGLSTGYNSRNRYARAHELVERYRSGNY